MSAKPWVICYDISDNKSRQRALYLLRKFATVGRSLCLNAG